MWGGRTKSSSCWIRKQGERVPGTRRPDMSRQPSKKRGGASAKRNGRAAANGAAPDSGRLLRWYRDMLLIRRFEERAGQMYGMGLIGGFCHLYIGQEAVVVGIQACLGERDSVVTTATCWQRAWMRAASWRNLPAARAAIRAARAAPCTCSRGRRTSSAGMASSLRRCPSASASASRTATGARTACRWSISATARPTRGRSMSRSISPRSGSCRCCS